MMIPFDTDYGNYSDFDSEHWSDDFYPSKHEREKAAEWYEIVIATKVDVLDDIAEHFGFDTSEWDKDDYETLMECLGLSDRL